jgi:hypothetical protein
MGGLLKMRKFIAILLTMAMIMAVVPPNVWVHTAGANGAITRAEWISELVELFDMIVEDDNIPDNYYSDIDEQSAYYRDVMVATQFGVIDIEAGEPFNPQDPVTREFASQTMNFCLGFMPDEDSLYPFSDVSAITYPDDAQIAVEREWFELVSGNFMPNQAVTFAEKAVIFADGAIVWESTEIDENHDNTYQFQSGVIEIPNGTDILIADNGTVTIHNNPNAISAGQTFIVYMDEIPLAYTALTVDVSGEVTTITTNEAEIDDLITEAEAEGIIDIDLSLAEPIDGSVITIIEEESPLLPFGITPLGTVRLSPININRTVSLGAGMSVTINATMSNLAVEYKVNALRLEAYVGISGTSTVTATADFDLATAGVSRTIDLATIPVAVVGTITVSAEILAEGKVNLVFSNDFSAGIQYSTLNGFRIVRSFTQRSFTINSELRIELGAKITIGITRLPFISGSVYARAGADVRLKSETRSGSRPNTCTHLTGHLYASVGANARVSVLGLRSSSWSTTQNIWTENNSPVRVVQHWEDGSRVTVCTHEQTRATLPGGNHSTQANSRYILPITISGGGPNGTGVPIVSEAQPTTISSNLTLTQNMTIPVGLRHTGGTINLNGFTLRVNGDLIQSGGTMNINGGTLNVSGNYRIQSRSVDSHGAVTYGNSSGGLRMSQSSDRVIVSGDFFTQSSWGLTNPNVFSAGIMEIGGNFTQLNGSNTNFNATGVHRIIFNGTGQQNISFASTSSGFNGVDFFNPNIKLNSAIRGFLLRQDIDLELGTNTLDVSGTLNLNGFSVTIPNDCTFVRGTLNINGGELIIDGGFDNRSTINIWRRSTHN